MRKSVIEEALRSGWKYCFKPNEKGEFPTLDELEFMGDEKDAGFIDFMSSLVEDIERKAFFKGYQKGASDCYADLPDAAKAELTMLDELNEQGAWRAYEEWLKTEADKCSH